MSLLEEIKKREIIARKAITKAYKEEQEYWVTQFVTLHLKEVDTSYWEKHTGSLAPNAEAIFQILELITYWEKEDEIEEYDLEMLSFVLPEDISNYRLSVQFDENGNLTGFGIIPIPRLKTFWSEKENLKYQYALYKRRYGNYKLDFDGDSNNADVWLSATDGCEDFISIVGAVYEEWDEEEWGDDYDINEAIGKGWVLREDTFFAIDGNDPGLPVYLCDEEATKISDSFDEFLGKLVVDKK